jgi:DNA topoisomerase-1
LGPKTLVIVESPTKARTLRGMLGRGYAVEACRGHVRDLPEGELGVDVEHDYEPRYVVPRGRRRILAQLKMRAASAETILLATDPDREGEAIAWHLVESLDLPVDRTWRVRFREITEPAVSAALAAPDRIDMARVHAQQARRVVDRIVGYGMSKSLSERFDTVLSAGRVQSAALRMIARRERRVRAFRPRETWELDALIRPLQGASRDDAGATPPGEEPREIRARLEGEGGARFVAANEAEVRDAIARLEGVTLRAGAIRRRRRRVRPPAPLRTSTLLEEASARLGLRASMTLGITQELFEGVEIEGTGPMGLVTYPRTDSVRVAQEAIAACRAFLVERFGAEYVPSRPRRHAAPRTSQDAHEAVRPTRVDLEPDRVRNALAPDAARLYELIWRRFAASQAMPAVLVEEEATLETDRGGATLRARASFLAAPGFLAVLGDDAPSDDDPAVRRRSLESGGAWREGAAFRIARWIPRPRRKEPPPRFTEASLVRALERAGIGRPSTYASVVEAIEERRYVDARGGTLLPTELGLEVAGELERRFPEWTDARFTAEFERDLDRIEGGRADYRSTVERVHRAFTKAQAR